MCMLLSDAILTPKGSECLFSEVMFIRITCPTIMLLGSKVTSTVRVAVLFLEKSSCIFPQCILHTTQKNVICVQLVGRVGSVVLPPVLVSSAVKVEHTALFLPMHRFPLKVIRTTRSAALWLGLNPKTCAKNLKLKVCHKTDFSEMIIVNIR